ncbi:hypothetical protein EYF80_029747 [Liparis tanakae]|uniref:Uncharacterized protein n=1 Tax=Liparis tanakae TaxID=230148 RepID=A0A4Z2H2I5_9TELE|nr:hypothetical protein EYF80_029747 [Liparis tanakae]
MLEMTSVPQGAVSMGRKLLPFHLVSQKKALVGTEPDHLLEWVQGVQCLNFIRQQVPSCPAAITPLPTAMFMVARVSVSRDPLTG